MNEWFSCILHLDQCMNTLAQAYPTWVWVILFAVIFAETGLVIMPFLPGDSLLFITGAIAAKGAYSPHTMALLLIIAAILGDTLNYHLGKKFGHLITAEGSRWRRWIKPKHIMKTEEFFERYGAFTIVIGRFAPIVRTFAPFLAGMGHMRYSTFIRYNILGATIWITLFLYAGYFLGGIPIVQQNLKWIMLAIIIISLMPIILQALRGMKADTSSHSS